MTRLPPDAPRPYGRAQLGEKTLAWMRRKGWIDNRYVLRLVEVKPTIELVA